VVVNDVGKAFYWTPHQQMFAMLVPVATVLIGRWVLLSRPGWIPMAAVGFVVAFAPAYGSVVITVAVVALLLLARGWRGLVPTASFLACCSVAGCRWSCSASSSSRRVSTAPTADRPPPLPK
jgi:hypothetical protein